MPMYDTFMYNLARFVNGVFYAFSRLLLKIF